MPAGPKDRVPSIRTAPAFLACRLLPDVKAAALLDLEAPEAALEALNGLDATRLPATIRDVANRKRLRALSQIDPRRAKAIIEDETDGL